MLCIPLIFCFGYSAVTLLLQKQPVVDSNVASKSACVSVIVLLETNKNKIPNKTKYVEFIKLLFTKNTLLLQYAPKFEV